MNEQEQFANKIRDLLQDQLADLWTEDTEVLDSISVDIAKQAWMATYGTVSERMIARDNLRLLDADLVAHGVIKQLKLTEKGKVFFFRTLDVVIKTLLVAAI